MRELRKELQMVFQDPYSSLHPRRRIRQTIAEPMIVQGMDQKEALARVPELMRTVQLDPRRADAYPHEFSGGQRQRIGIARALSVDPEVLVLDEPLSALDVSVQADIINLLQRLQQQLRLAFVFISHNLSVVRYLADEVGVMYLGQIVEIGSAEDVLAGPAHPYTKALLSAAPVPDPRAERTKQRIVLGGEVPSALDPPSGCRFHPRCWMAQDICRVETPALIERGNGHPVACHFATEASHGQEVSPRPDRVGSLARSGLTWASNDFPPTGSSPAPGGRGRSAWHLFGPDDNVGLINLQTPERVAAAAGEIRHGRVFDLNAPIDCYDPPLYGRNATKHRLIPEAGDTGFDDELDTFNPQAGSQWDSLAHVPSSPGNFYNGVTVAQIRESHRNTIGHWVAHGIAGRGVMLDVERFAARPPGEAVGVTVGAARAVPPRGEHRVRARRHPGALHRLRPLVRRPARVRAAAMADDRVLTAAGVDHTEEMAEYLWDLHVSAIVSDSPSVEVWPPNWSRKAQPFGFLHHTLIGLFGMPLGELWWLADLADDCRGDGRYTMFLASAPLECSRRRQLARQRGGLQVRGPSSDAKFFAA